MQKHIQIKKKLVMTKNAGKSIKGKKHNRHSVPKIDTQYMNRMVLSMY